MTDTVAYLASQLPLGTIYVPPSLLLLFLFAFVSFVVVHELELRLPSLVLGPPDERQPL